MAKQTKHSKSTVDAPAPFDPSGNPAEGGKQRLILDAAAEVFLQKGFSATNVDDIRDQAGVSKATIYSHFRTKEALFAAVVEELRETIMAPLAAAEIRAKPPEEALPLIARNFTTTIFSSRGGAIHRVMFGEANRMPDLAQAFYREGPAQLIANLARYIEEQIARGRLVATDPTLAAEHFIGLLTGAPLIRRLLLSSTPQDQKNIEQRTNEAVSIFIRAYGTRK